MNKLQPLDLEELSNEILRKIKVRNKKRMIKYILQQHLKSACEFYLRYKDNPELFCKEQFKIRWEYYLDTGYLVWNISKKQWENYNEWLFRLAFKDVLGDDENEA